MAESLVMTKQRAQRQLYDAVRRALWEDWDPIGRRDLGGPDDEYDSYAGTITRFILEGRDEDFLSQHLARLESDAMGLSDPDPNQLRPVARKLISLLSTRHELTS